MLSFYQSNGTATIYYEKYKGSGLGFPSSLACSIMNKKTLLDGDGDDDITVNKHKFPK